MRKIEEFQREYSSLWIEPNQKAYELWIYYHYNCERFDRTVCTGRVEFDSIMPAIPHEYRIINENASAFRREILQKAKEYEISGSDWQQAKQTVSRLSWEGLQREYKRLYE